MCGISGILHFDTRQKVNKKLLKKMTDTLQHRGPDGEGFFVKDNIGLGHRRLSIIDLDTGDQPMFSDDKSIALVFNGEIYNYIELRDELKKLGHAFKTPSDTEVVIRAYEQWGYECQNKFNGMWAFALWDARKQELFLSRDRIGEKPLYYTQYRNVLIFASELKALFAYGVPQKPRLELIEIYAVFKNIPAPYTFFNSVFKLMPGSYLLAGKDGTHEHRYWDMPALDEDNLLQDKGMVYDQFEYLFEDAVKIRMRSDVPYGAFLSGGLDSASIVATMAGISSYPVKTFTIGYQEKEFDESGLAGLVAESYHTDHTAGMVTPDSFEETVKKIVYHYDEPFGDSSAIPTGYVSRFAARHVKMVLTGDGGDEALSGYPAYQGVKFAGKYQQLPEFSHKIIQSLFKTGAQFAPGKFRYKLNRYNHLLQTSLEPFNTRLLNKRAKPDYNLIKSLISPDIKVYPARDYLDDFMKKCTFKDEFYRQMYFNYKFDLPNDYLVKVDRMSMAWSLETRLPFLDVRLIEFLAGVDKKVKMQGWERKSILRRTIAKRLPEKLLTAPKKGFRVPVREWFKDAGLMDQLEREMLNSGVINQNLFKTLLNENKTGRADHGNLLWSLLLLAKTLE